jgi:hypothetical protein
MVSTKILKLHELETLEDYFNHILLNEINGNRGDVRKLIKDLSKEQKRDCMDFLSHHSGSDAAIVKNLIIESL